MQFEINISAGTTKMLRKFLLRRHFFFILNSIISRRELQRDAELQVKEEEKNIIKLGIKVNGLENFIIVTYIIFNFAQN